MNSLFNELPYILYIIDYVDINVYYSLFIIDYQAQWYHSWEFYSVSHNKAKIR